MVKFADDFKTRWQQECPKKNGTKSATRYDKYKKAKTVGEAMKLGATNTDLEHDLKKGFLKVSDEKGNPVNAPPTDEYAPPAQEQAPSSSSGAAAVPPTKRIKKEKVETAAQASGAKEKATPAKASSGAKEKAELAAKTSSVAARARESGASNSKSKKVLVSSNLQSSGSESSPLEGYPAKKQKTGASDSANSHSRASMYFGPAEVRLDRQDSVFGWGKFGGMGMGAGVALDQRHTIDVGQRCPQGTTKHQLREPETGLRYAHIGAMNCYKTKSIEELRNEDYQANRLQAQKSHNCHGYQQFGNISSFSSPRKSTFPASPGSASVVPPNDFGFAATPLGFAPPDKGRLEFAHPPKHLVPEWMQNKTKTNSPNFECTGLSPQQPVPGLKLSSSSPQLSSSRSMPSFPAMASSAPSQSLHHLEEAAIAAAEEAMAAIQKAQKAVARSEAASAALKNQAGSIEGKGKGKGEGRGDALSPDTAMGKSKDKVKGKAWFKADDTTQCSRFPVGPDGNAARRSEEEKMQMVRQVMQALAMKNKGNGKGEAAEA